MIVFDDVWKSYQSKGERKEIVSGLTVEIPARAKLALLGRNGAGKSTLLKLIAGSAEPDSGLIYRRGTISWPLGFSGSFHPALTGRQNTRFVARIYGIDTEELVAFAEDFSELGSYFDMQYGTYSSGMRARLAFGVSIGVRFDFYLVDEITAVGDAVFREKCHRAFQETLCDAGLIMVSHNPKTILDYCESGAVLNDGEFNYFERVEDAVAFYNDQLAVV